MKSLYYIAGILPAQFRSSQVDCGIGWKEHVKQEPPVNEAVDEALDTMLQEFETAKETAKQEFTKESFKEFVSKIEQSPVWIGVDPAAESKPSIDLSTIKPGDKVMLVDGKTFDSFWGKNLTVNGIYTVCEADPHEYQGVRVYDEKGRKIWVYNTDVRPIGFNPATKTWTVDDMSKLDYTKVKVGDKLVFADTEANRQHAPYATQAGLIYTVHAFEENRLLLCWDEL